MNQTPFEKYVSLGRFEGAIEQRERRHLKLAEAMLKAGGRKMYLADMFWIAVMQRSLALCSGIFGLVKDWNYVCAGSLMRLQLDNLMRCYLVSCTPKGQDFIKPIFEGKRLNKEKDHEGKKLTDRRLRELCAEAYPWLDKVYEETSKLIHLSEKHFSISVVRLDDAERSITYRIAARQEHWPENEIDELLGALIVATDAILDICEGWIKLKNQSS